MRVSFMDLAEMAIVQAQINLPDNTNQQGYYQFYFDKLVQRWGER